MWCKQVVNLNQDLTVKIPASDHDASYKNKTVEQYKHTVSAVADYLLLTSLADLAQQLLTTWTPRTLVRLSADASC